MENPRLLYNNTKFDLNCELFFMNVLFFLVTKGINKLYWNSYWFFFLFIEKKLFFFQEFGIKSILFTNQLFMLSFPWTNNLNWFPLKLLRLRIMLVQKIRKSSNPQNNLVLRWPWGVMLLNWFFLLR